MYEIAWRQIIASVYNPNPLLKEKNTMEIEPLVFDDFKAAKLLGVSVYTLRKWRTTGDGPAYRKFGKTVRYIQGDIEAYIEKSIVTR